MANLGLQVNLKEKMMDATKRRAIEAAGWKVGNAAEFLKMSAEERQLLDARISRWRFGKRKK